MKLALGSTVMFSVLAFSLLFHIGYQFGPLVELANAQMLVQNDFDAGLALSLIHISEPTRPY